MMETDELLLIPKGRTKDAMNHLWPNRGAGWAEHLPPNLKSIPLAPRRAHPRSSAARPLPLNQSRLIPAITLLIIACCACLAPAAAREGAGGSEPSDPV